MKVKIGLGMDGYIVASCPALKGCVTQGRTEEAMRNIKEAVDLGRWGEEGGTHEDYFQPKGIRLGSRRRAEPYLP